MYIVLYIVYSMLYMLHTFVHTLHANKNVSIKKVHTVEQSSVRLYPYPGITLYARVCFIHRTYLPLYHNLGNGLTVGTE